MLKDLVSSIKGIGPKYQKILSDSNIRTKEDLLLFMPTRYINYSISSPSDIKSDITTTIRGRLTSRIASFKSRNTTGIIFYLISDDEKIKVVAFGMDYLRFKLKMNQEYVVFGSYKYMEKTMYMSKLFDNDFKNYIEPVYPIHIPNSYMMKFISDVYEERPLLNDDIPSFILDKRGLLDMNTYLFRAHFPNDLDDCSEVLKRSIYETYLKYNIRLNAMRYYYDASKRAPKRIDYLKVQELISSLPYKLTEGQLNAIEDIFKDFRGERLLNRLIQGDVGSGKTIVAFIALYTNYLAGFQGALMVPSEVLSNQHYDKAKKILEPFGLRISLLNSGIKASEKKKIYNDLKNGDIDLIIGTQSLIQDSLEFKNLGLVVIDEQHRFGVRERQNLINKGLKCDALFMTATPIPRTLGITRFADLDISTIDVMPASRKRVLTKVCSIDDDEFIAKAIYKNVSKGYQVFVVVPVINESVTEGVINIEEAHERLKRYLPNVRFKILHGGIKSAEKDMIMKDFNNHMFDCLISTTVIEVGIDIKNATLMVIYNAERYGLATLHQLRGRVGRNDLVSGCILVSDDKECSRLKIMEETFDCFKLAEADLEERGPGDFLGSSQSGFMNMNIMSNLEIWNLAREDADELYKAYIKGNKYKIVTDIIDDNNENNKLN